jgi:acyl homoserine lactone synthase
MFRDRARQFHDRLGWAVKLDQRGWEQDEYDQLDPLYIIWEGQDGLHKGSMRLLPTTGQTMVKDHFLHLTGGVAIQSSDIWECTRFCLAPGAQSRIAAALMLAGGEVMRAFELTHFIGVFDHRMTRIYRMIGSSPVVLGETGKGVERIAVGLWGYDRKDRSKVLHQAGLSSALSEHWFRRAFDRQVHPCKAVG